MRTPAIIFSPGIFSPSFFSIGFLSNNARYAFAVVALIGCVFFAPSPLLAQSSSEGSNQSARQVSPTDPLVSAELSQASIVLGDAVALTITAKNIDQALDLSSLERDFRVISRSSSREVRFINGVETATSSWVIQIEPNRTGVLTVPAVSVGSYQSRPLALNVGNPPTGAARDVFVEATVDIDSPYVQSQVLMTVKVWQSVNVLESSKVNLGSDQFIAIALERDREYFETVDGKDFLVQEQQFSLFPQASGVHTFGPIELRAKVPLDNTQRRGLFAPTRNIKRLSNPITLNVRPRPDAVQGKWWLPASDVQILDSWSAEPSQINANDPLTRTIEVVATGVNAEQLPDMPLPNIDGLKLYSGNVERSSSATDAGIVSRQKITWAVVPEVNGEVRVPAVNIEWFNTTTGVQSVAELPAMNLTVTGVLQEAAPLLSPSNAGSGSDASQSSGDRSAQNSSALVNPDAQALTPIRSSGSESAFGSSSMKTRMLWLVLGAAALLILQAIAYMIYRLRQRLQRASHVVKPQAQDTVQVPSLDAVRSALQSRKLPEVQQAILNWSALFWPKTQPHSLLVVAQKLKEPTLERVFEQMDANLYGYADVDIDLSTVEKRLKQAANRLVATRQTVVQGSQLPSL